jgi:hypothetical protein
VLTAAVLIVGCSKVDEVQPKPAAVQTAPATPQAAPVISQDIGLKCDFASANDGNGPSKILIYSPENNIGKFGKVSADDVWEPEYRIDNKTASISEIEFELTSYDMLLVMRLNPNVKKRAEMLRINRASLFAILSIESQYGGPIVMNFKCEKLTNEDFKKYVKWVTDNTNAQKGSNKI